MHDESVLEEIRHLEKVYEETYGKKVDYIGLPSVLTMEGLVECLKLMIDDNLSILEAFSRLYT